MTSLFDLFLSVFVFYGVYALKFYTFSINIRPNMKTSD